MASYKFNQIFQKTVIFRHTVRAPIERALQQNAPPKKNMLTFSFYIIFELKFHQKKGLKIIQDARSNGAPTVSIRESRPRYVLTYSTYFNVYKQRHNSLINVFQNIHVRFHSSWPCRQAKSCPGETAAVRRSLKQPIFLGVADLPIILYILF